MKDLIIKAIEVESQDKILKIQEILEIINCKHTLKTCKWDWYPLADSLPTTEYKNLGSILELNIKHVVWTWLT